MGSEKVEPICDHYNRCGGCSEQTVPYQKQLKEKEIRVKELLTEAGIENYEYLGIEPSPQTTEYRNNMEFSFGDLKKEGELQLGMHPRGKQYDVVTVNTCQLVDEDFRKILTTVLEYCREQGFKKYHIKLRTGFVRHLVVRKGINTGEILVNLVTTSQNNHDFNELADRLMNLNYKGELVGFLQTINDDYANDVKCDELITYRGRNYFEDKLLGLRFRIKPFSFFQVNTLAAEKMYNKIRDYLGNRKDRIIYDLYCGTGSISLSVADLARKIYGIEQVEEAVEAARKNAEINNIDNCHFLAGDVFERLEEIDKTPDTIIIDPPRPGIHPKTMPKILEYGAEEIIYISCNPQSLARDLKEFSENRYQIKQLQCIDMFPHTGHIESCCRLTSLDNKN